MTGRYDPHKHHRRSIRLKGWDYRSPAVYFVTICTHERQPLLDDERFRQIVENCWLAIPARKHARHVELDEWVVMPNHLHGLIIIVDGEERPVSVPRPTAAPRGSLGAIVGNFKSMASRQINGLRQTRGAPVWQKGYYERIVRNEWELQAIRRYIEDNPRRWAEDRENLDRLVARMDLAA